MAIKMSYQEVRYRGKARKKVLFAVKNGVIIKPENCQKCGEVGQIVGHHIDYDKPLEVLWVCQKCHYILHGQILHIPQGIVDYRYKVG